MIVQSYLVNHFNPDVNEALLIPFACTYLNNVYLEPFETFTTNLCKCEWGLHALILGLFLPVCAFFKFVKRCKVTFWNLLTCELVLCVWSLVVSCEDICDQEFRLLETYQIICEDFCDQQFRLVEKCQICFSCERVLCGTPALAWSWGSHLMKGLLESTKTLNAATKVNFFYLHKYLS